MKKRGLQFKLILSVNLIIIIILAMSALIHARYLKQNYLRALQERSEALAQYISIDITQNQRYVLNIQDMLETETFRCIQLFEANQTNNVTHVAIVNSSFEIVAHNDKQLLKTSITSPILRNAFEAHTPQLVLEQNIYHTLIPILMGNPAEYIATIDVGFPKEMIEAENRTMLMNTLRLFIISLLLAFVGISLFARRVLLLPLSRLMKASEELAAGKLVSVPGASKTGDEIVMLAANFNHISEYFRHVSDVAAHVSDGILDAQVQVRSEFDIMGNAAHKMVKYLNNIAAAATKIAEGDLTEIIDIRSPEDTLGRVFFSMTEGLRMLVRQIRISAEQIMHTGHTITSLTGHDIKIVQHVESSVDQMVSTMTQMGASIEEVSHNMETLSSSAEETSASATQMTASIRQIAKDASELTNETDQTILALKGAVETLRKIVEHTDVSKTLSQTTMQDAQEGQTAVEQVMNGMTTIQHTVTMAVESINGFAKRSEDIGTILGVIKNITEQTTLLALNASIIAAQAGSHGRGFAVVADEIKSLADGVGKSTKDIAAIVRKLQNDTQEVARTIYEGAANVQEGMRQTEQARQTLQKISSSAERSSAVVTQIAETLHGMLQESRDITRSMKRVSAMTNDIKRATKEQETTTMQINIAIEQINEMSSQIHRATTEQTNGVHHLLTMSRDITGLIEQNRESSQHIAATVRDLTQQGDLLAEAVGRFKLNETETFKLNDDAE